MFHVRADVADETLARLAHAFASNVVIDEQGPAGTLRREATAAGTPTIAVEMGEAHRFQRALIDEALASVERVLVDVHIERGDLVHGGERIAAITSPFRTEDAPIRAPFTGLQVGVLENPLVYPGNPFCHLVHVDERTRRAIEGAGNVCARSGPWQSPGTDSSEGCRAGAGPRSPLVAPLQTTRRRPNSRSLTTSHPTTRTGNSGTSRTTSPRKMLHPIASISTSGRPR